MLLKKLSLSEEFSEIPNLGDIIKVDEPICLLHLKSKNIDFLEETMIKKELQFFFQLQEELQFLKISRSRCAKIFER